MPKYFPIYEEAVSHIWFCNCSIQKFLIYEENLIFFFISVIERKAETERRGGGGRTPTTPLKPTAFCPTLSRTKSFQPPYPPQQVAPCICSSGRKEGSFFTDSRNPETPWDPWFRVGGKLPGHRLVNSALARLLQRELKKNEGKVVSVFPI